MGRTQVEIETATDTRALLDYLDTRAAVAGKRVGVTGYCMGGRHTVDSFSRLSRSHCGGEFSRRPPRNRL